MLCTQADTGDHASGLKLHGYTEASGMQPQASTVSVGNQRWSAAASVTIPASFWPISSTRVWSAGLAISRATGAHEDNVNVAAALALVL